MTAFPPAWLSTAPPPPNDVLSAWLSVKVQLVMTAIDDEPSLQIAPPLSPVDLFPAKVHVECVALIERK
jgi:hypothetical protein